MSNEIKDVGTSSELLWKVLPLLLPEKIVSLLKETQLGQKITIRPIPSLKLSVLPWAERATMVRAQMAKNVLAVLRDVPIIHFCDLATLQANAFGKSKAGAAMRRELKVVLKNQQLRGNLIWDKTEDGYIWQPQHKRELKLEVALFTKPLTGLCRVPVEEVAGAILLLASRTESGPLDPLLRDVLALYGLSRNGSRIERALERALRYLGRQCTRFECDELTFRCDRSPFKAA